MSTIEAAAATSVPSRPEDIIHAGTVAQTVIHVTITGNGFVTIENDSSTNLYWAFSPSEVDIDPTATTGGTMCAGPIAAFTSQAFHISGKVVETGSCVLNLVRDGSDTGRARVRRS